MIYEVSNKVFSVFFATRELAEDFCRYNSNVANGLHITEVKVIGLAIK